MLKKKIKLRFKQKTKSKLLLINEVLLLKGNETAFLIKLKLLFTKNLYNIVILKTGISKFYLLTYMQAIDSSLDDPIV